jgi:3-deoxy-D-manno-octulosonic-acid transferase
LRHLYSFLFYLFTPVILLRLAWRGWRAPAYWQRWPERFGFLPELSGTNSIWIHAVSVGEVQAAVPLIHALQSRFPKQSLLVTTMTPTGSQRLREVFGDKVEHVYLPYDLPDAIARFLARVQPRLLILLETELWPNWLSACRRRAMPVILANARLSAPSAAGYRWIDGLMREMLGGVSMIAAQTEEDAERLLALGATPSQVQVTGSIKFDSPLPANLAEQVARLRQQWGRDRLVWIAASTHEGEEEQVLEAFATVTPLFNNLLLVLVPRHPERFKRVATLCQQRGYVVVRRSEGKTCSAATSIYLGDTMGELPLLYAACEVAFVGGSLVPIGGHNLMEPAAVGVPIIVGTYLFECAEIARRLLEAGAAQQVSNSVELARVLAVYLGDAKLRKEMGEKGRFFVQQNQGALERLLSVVSRYL